MGLLNKFSKWYFSKSALPYWCVLILDSLILIVSALFIRLIKVGATAFIGSFSAVLLYLLLTLVSFVVAWRFFRTYSGILRFSSFVDLERVVLANITAGAILFVLSLVLGWLKFSSDIIALPSIIENITVVVVTLIGSSAMAGTIGGGGLGDLAIRYGYQRFQADVMVATILVLIVVVQLIQFIGSNLAKKANKK